MQFDGITSGNDRICVVAATNRPHGEGLNQAWRPDATESCAFMKHCAALCPMLLRSPSAPDSPTAPLAAPHTLPFICSVPPLPGSAELDHAARRRFTKRIYVPLPNASARYHILVHLLRTQPQVALAQADLDFVVGATEGFSASDITSLCKEAAMGPVREMGYAISHVDPAAIRPVDVRDFDLALRVTKPSVNPQMLLSYERFMKEFGST